MELSTSPQTTSIFLCSTKTVHVLSSLPSDLSLALQLLVISSSKLSYHLLYCKGFWFESSNPHFVSLFHNGEKHSEHALLHSIHQALVISRIQHFYSLLCWVLHSWSLLWSHDDACRLSNGLQTQWFQPIISTEISLKIDLSWKI